MHLLGIFSSDGCSGSHHFGDWEDDLHKTRTQFTRNGLRVEVYQRRSCQHDGCHEVETRWADVRATSEREIEGFREGNFLELTLTDEQRDVIEHIAEQFEATAERSVFNEEMDSDFYDTLTDHAEVLRDILDE